MMLGTALIALTGWGTTELERTSARARELCTALGDPPELFGVSYRAWNLRAIRADMRAAKDAALLLLAKAEDIHDPAALRMAHGAMGETLFYMGQARLAAEHFRSALALDDPDHPLAPMGIDLRVTHLCYLGLALFLLGYPDQALHRELEAVARARTLSHPHTAALANGNIATVRLLRGSRKRRLRSVDNNSPCALSTGWPIFSLGQLAFGGQYWRRERTKKGYR
jgi:hypothetical protein